MSAVCVWVLPKTKVTNQTDIDACTQGYYHEGRNGSVTLKLKSCGTLNYLGKDTGLSVALFISVVMTSSTKSMVSFTTP